MPKKVKEEERIEKVIRGLLKLPENKRCINCNSLGPQYVCTTFWTFVCTNCSGVHREFTHRVKSVSMAKFSAEEVAALQAGGNERARQIYFKAWDPQRNYFPDGSNLHRLRDFIKHVYVDRKYAGVRSNDKLTMVETVAKDHYQERHSFEISRHGAREDLSECRSSERTDHDRRDDFFERHSFENSFPSRRNEDRNLGYQTDQRKSSRYKQEKLKCGSQSSRTPHFEIVDDRFREDGFGTVRKFGSQRYSNAESRARSSSPIAQKSGDMTSRPAIRSLKDILDDKFPPIKVGEPPKPNVVDGSAHIQEPGSSRGRGSVNKKEDENKTVNSVSSLIDFDTNPEPSATTAVVHTQQTVPAGDGGKNTVPSASEKGSNTPNVNSLESLLFGLADPPGSTSDMPLHCHTPVANVGSLDTDVNAVTESQTKTQVVFNDVGITTASQTENALAFPSGSSDSRVKVTDTKQLPAMQQSLPFAVPAGNNSSTAQQATTSPEALYDQSSTSQPAHVKGPPTDSSFEQSPLGGSKTAQDTSLGNALIPAGRNELPVDLFTSSYLSFATEVPGWHSRPPYGMGYGTQYHPIAVSMGAPVDSVKSRNPFDIGDDDPQHQANMFLSMSSLQGALPNMSPSPGLQSQVSPYASAMYPHRPSYEMMLPQVHMGQQLPNNMIPSSPQGVNSFGHNDAAFASLNHIQQSSGTNNDAAFASLNPIQQQSGVNPLSAAPNSLPLRGGNPFG